MCKHLWRSDIYHRVTMADAMSEYLKQDMQCEGLLECIHGLKELDKEIFLLLTERSEPLTVDEVAEAVDRERSTAYRSIQRLVQSGFVQKEQVNYEQGGYHHVYHTREAEAIAGEMQRMLNDWYAKMGQLIGEFRKKYDEWQGQTLEVEH